MVHQLSAWWRCRFLKAPSTTSRAGIQTDRNNWGIIHCGKPSSTDEYDKCHEAARSRPSPQWKIDKKRHFEISSLDDINTWGPGPGPGAEGLINNIKSGAGKTHFSCKTQLLYHEKRRGEDPDHSAHRALHHTPDDGPLLFIYSGE